MYPRLMVAGWLVALLLVGNVQVAYLLRHKRRGSPRHWPLTWLIIIPAYTLWAFTPVAWLWAACYTPWALWHSHHPRLAGARRQGRQQVRSHGYAAG